MFMHYDLKIAGKRPKSFENTINFPTFALVFVKKSIKYKYYQHVEDL